MIGAGAVAFAVMGYVITHQEHDRGLGWVVRLNPILLGTILGETPERVSEAISFLCEPDHRSTSDLEEGRRLVPVTGESTEYRVVNGDKYQEAREYEDRLEQNRLAQARWRANHNLEQRAGPAARFVPPSQEACRAEAVKLGMPEGEGNAFWHFYESKGWKVGKVGMKSWRSAMVNWRKGWQERGGKPDEAAPGGSGETREEYIAKLVDKAAAKSAAEELSRES